MELNKMDPPATQAPLPLFGGLARGRRRVYSSMELKSIRDGRELAVEMMRADPVLGRTDGFYADHLGIDRSPWSKMLSGKIRFALTEREWDEMERLTGCIGMYQRWDALRKGYDLVPHKESPEEELERLRAEREHLLAQRA